MLSSEENKPKKKLRKDRRRAKKGSHKLTPKQVEMIRSQKGKMSIREICKWFKEKHHGIHRVSPGLVCRILNNQVHKPKEDKVSIYDLIESGDYEGLLGGLDVRDIDLSDNRED